MHSEILKELESEFEKLKKELKFKATLEELDEEFFIFDYVQDKGFLNTSLSRMICARAVDLFMSWYGYLHSLIIPNPQSILNITESQLFDEKEKGEIQQTMSRLLTLTSKNGYIGLIKDRKEEAKFIDECLSTWLNLKPKLAEILKRVNKTWQEKAETLPEIEKRAHFG